VDQQQVHINLLYLINNKKIKIIEKKKELKGIYFPMAIIFMELEQYYYSQFYTHRSYAAGGIPKAGCVPKGINTSSDFGVGCLLGTLKGQGKTVAN
jgi:hypothetical protein